MPDFAAARHQMVQNQLEPNRVDDTRVASAMEAIPRERFVPDSMAGVAYLDEDIEIAAGRYLMEPMVFARMLQAAVSRQREYLADASAVQFTREPEGIAGALKKIGGQQYGSKVVNPKAM